jgi:hypothetical protein
MEVTQEFEVEGIVYAIMFKNNEFFLYVNGEKSKVQTYKPVYDDFDAFFSDFPSEPEPKPNLFNSSHLLKAKKPMLIYIRILRFIDSIISKKNPYYFCYTANERNKIKVYKAFGERICKKFNYSLLVDKKKFSFYRN